MALGGFITIEFVARAGDGKLVPDIDPADLEDLQRFQVNEDEIDVWHFQKGQHYVIFHRRPDFGTNRIFEVVCSTEAAWNAVKDRVAAKAFDYAEAANRPAAQDAWLVANGYVKLERASAPGVKVAVLPQHTVCGQSPIAVATDGLALADDDEWVVA